MNTANLQLEGVYAVMAALLKALVDKKVFGEAELSALLADVERGIAEDAGRPIQVRSSNVEAMRFPARFLKLALAASTQARQPSFAEIASQVGRSTAE